MMYLQKAFTVAAAPEKITECEACVYGRGAHAPWCQEGLVLDPYRAYSIAPLSCPMQFREPNSLGGLQFNPSFGPLWSAGNPEK